MKYEIFKTIYYLVFYGISKLSHLYIIEVQACVASWLGLFVCPAMERRSMKDGTAAC